MTAQREREKRPVLLILNTPPPFGGGEIRGTYLKDYFADNRNYLLFTYSRKGSSKSSQGQPTFRNVIWGLFLIFKTLGLLIRYRPDKIYLMLPKNFSAFMRTAVMVWLARRLRVRVLADLAGASFPFLHNGALQRNVGLYFLRQLDDIKVLGQGIKSYLAEFGIEQTRILNNGVRIPASVQVTQDVIYGEPLNLLYVGALNFSKGIQKLVQAVELCKRNQVDVHLHLLGEWSNPEHQREIETFIKSHVLEERLTFHGLVTDDRKWQVYQSCALLVHPTHWDGQPLTILEAMGVGLGIISTHVGAIPDTIEDGTNGVLLQENTPEQIFQAIKLFYEDRDRLVRISETNIQTYQQTYTVEAFCQRMQNWFES